jgi:WD40 repeat protein
MQSPPRVWSRWLALVLGLSLLLNIALIVLVVRPHAQTLTIKDRVGGENQPEKVPSSAKSSDSSTRIVTDRLPPGYRAILRGHPGSISALCFSADRTRMALATDSGYLAVWKMNSWEVEWQADTSGSDNGHVLLTNALAFSNRNDQFAYATAETSASGHLFAVRLRRLAERQERVLQDKKVFEELGNFAGLTFSPDGQTLAVGCYRGVVLFDVQRGVARAILRPEKSFYYRDLSYSHDGSNLMAATWPNPVLFNAGSGKRILGLKPQSQPNSPCSTAISPAGDRIASGSYQNEISAWKSDTGAEVFHFSEGVGSGWTEGRCYVSFTSDAKFLLTASRGDDLSKIFVRRRDPITGSLIDQVEVIQPGDPCPYVYPRLFTIDGSFLALIGTNASTQLPRGVLKGIVAAREGCVAILDVSRLFERRPLPRLISR